MQLISGGTNVVFSWGCNYSPERDVWREGGRRGPSPRLLNKTSNFHDGLSPHIYTCQDIHIQLPASNLLPTAACIIQTVVPSVCVYQSKRESEELWPWPKCQTICAEFLHLSNCSKSHARVSSYEPPALKQAIVPGTYPNLDIFSYFVYT